ncbi:exodeoxyribonuclease V subunit gamma [Thauera sp. WH-1]|uniref:exodeoxyribonuclease V subunit gamma n=1 Tax=Thauera sp. WH-1 TaxID=3398230 RepID=UPI0039FDB4E3
MLSLSFSNRFEILLDELLERLAEEQPGPFGEREVVVPSAALRRRLELAVADHEGVCANLRCDFLAQWLWQQIGRVVPEVPARSPFSPALLAWRIHGLLDADAAEGAWLSEHPRLAHYLAGADARMRFELAERIARVFDHYLTYRPQWLARWSEGRGSVLEADASAAARADEAWQAALWRRIREAMGLRSEHPATAFLRAVTAMDHDALAATGLPRSVHVFGLPALPPLYLDMLRELARVVDVRLYVLNPCREFWFDIVDARRLSWLATRQQDLFFETGNRLLAAWGKQTRAHIGLLFEGEHVLEDEALFAPHPGRHLLARVHNAILDLQELPPAGVKLAAADRSIEVHVCHSRTRELEVLHDRLLGLFKAHEGTPDALSPADVVVLTPDLEASAPLIEAVFGTAPPARRIPWRITGLGGTHDNPIAQVLDRMLGLAASRFPATQVFDLLQQAPVAAHHGLDDTALETIHDWLRAAGVRWGLDAGAVHAVLGQPGGEPTGLPHTLEEGLHRLFLAWAAGDAAQHASFAGRIGAAAPEGQAALALGRFWRYAESLRSLRTRLLQDHDAAGWRALLNEVLDRLVGDAATWADELRELRAAIAQLADDMTAGGCAAAQGLAVIRPALAALLDDPARGGVPGGTLSFSALSSLRGLPYRVVCVIGLDHGLFPGSDRAAEFDLMAARPQAGDRQRRLDERNLFLDVLLSAREVLHLSYVGRSVRDGSELRPSVLVDELLDVLAEATASSATDPDALAAARQRLCVAHPLQAFAPDYFLPAERGDARLVSFNEGYAEALAARLGAAARAAAASPNGPVADAEHGAEPAAANAQAALAEASEGTSGGASGGAIEAVTDGESEGASDDEGEGPFAVDVAPFFERPLPPPGPEWRSLTLERLVRFYRNPCRELLRERLGLDLPEADAELEDTERFVPDRPARWALAERLMPVLLGAQADGRDPALRAAGEGAGRDDAALAQLARAGGEFPRGAMGEAGLAAELAAMRDFAARLAVARCAPAIEAASCQCAFALAGEPWTLGAVLGELRPEGMLRWRYADAGASHYLEAWIAHLMLCAGGPAGVERRTRVLLRDADVAFAALDPAQAHELLAGLLALYREGLMQPLHFFPKSAWACVSNDGNARKAHDKWTGGQRAQFGEGRDPAYRLALRGVEQPLDARFFALAQQVFGPLREHLQQAGADGLAPPA